MEFEVERITLLSDPDPCEDPLPEDCVDARRITELDDEEDVEPPLTLLRGAAGMTPVARGAGIGRGVCIVDALRVTRINDPGAGALDEPPLTTSLVDAERITGSVAVFEDTGLKDTGLDEIGLASDRSTRADTVGEGVVIDAPDSMSVETLRLRVWLGRLGADERKDRCTIATGARKVVAGDPLAFIDR